MGRPSGEQSARAETMKLKRKQMKVVYISNPVRFRTSASEFMGLVQRFTGRDSVVADLCEFAGEERRRQGTAAAPSGESSSDGVATLPGPEKHTALVPSSSPCHLSPLSLSLSLSLSQMDEKPRCSLL